MTPATRTRLSPDERRAQLVELGLELLSDRALHEVSIDEVAAQAGISKALVFHYFGSKPEFLEAIAQAASDEFFEVTEPDPTLSLEDQIRSSMEAFVRYVSENRVGYVLLVRGPGSGDEAMRQVFEGTRTRIVERIVSKLDLEEEPPSLRLSVRGWVAFAEEVTTSWVDDPALPESELLTLLVESLTHLVALALLGGDHPA